MPAVRGRVTRRRARLEARRRDYSIRREAGEPNPLAPGGDFSRIRPTHVDSYGVRYQIPVSPKPNVTVSVPMFYPSDDQMALRCDGCARSHRSSNDNCSASPQARSAAPSTVFLFKMLICYFYEKSGRRSVIPEGHQWMIPPCNPGEVVLFYSMTHDPGAVYKGVVESVTTHGGRKAGEARIKFRG